tara:strand:- start:168 stop:563 length:396 start_codon:yes stop_codon:yes gene_type:complete
MKEKDLNYIAALERAIEKKYGEEAIQNPAQYWDEAKEEEYIEQLKDYVEKQKKHEQERYVENDDGILISRKLLNKEGIINCPVCGKKTKTVDDDIYINKFECCSKCFIQYVVDRKKRWLNGWRPKNVTKSS